MQSLVVTRVTRCGVASVLPALVSGIAGIDFAARTLARLNDALPAASWSVYRLRRDGPPRLHLSASHGVADTQSISLPLTATVGFIVTTAVACRCRSVGAGTGDDRTVPDDLPSPLHRQAIYYRHAMLETARCGLDDRLAAGDQSVPLSNHQGLVRRCRSHAVCCDGRCCLPSCVGIWAGCGYHGDTAGRSCIRGAPHSAAAVG